MEELTLEAAVAASLHASGRKKKAVVSKRMELQRQTREKKRKADIALVENARKLFPCHEFKQGKVRCFLTKQRHAEYLQALEKSMVVSSGVTKEFASSAIFKTLRVTAIRGAATKEHTEDMRGTTFTHGLFHDRGGGIRYRVFPIFKCSVVTLCGKRVVPIDYRENKHLVVYALSSCDSNTTPQKLVLPPQFLLRMLPYGKELPYAIAGISGQKVQILSQTEKPHEVIPSASDLQKIPLEQVFRDATDETIVPSFHWAGENGSIPRNVWRKLGTTPGRWFQFYSWKYIHSYLPGKNVYAARSYVYFRQIKSVCVPGKSCSSGGNNKNVHMLKDMDDNAVIHFFDTQIKA